MSRTITAMFNDRNEAEQAAAQLRTQIGAEARIIDQSSGTIASSGERSRGDFWQDFKDMFVADDDRGTYEEGVRRGHFLLSASVPEDQADRACSLIEHAGAMDIDENEQKWRSEGWASAQGIRESSSSEFSGGRERGNIVEEERIPVVEEQLRVGKREEQRGGARVRSYVEERPVSEQVNLREEHVNVERRPVDQAISPDALDRDGLLQDREIEMHETAERAVVGKEPRVKEEVVIQKTANERTDTVEDTVRNTKIDIDEDKGAFGFDKDREASTNQQSVESNREREPSTSGRF